MIQHIDRQPTKPNRYAVYDDNHNFIRYEYHERADEPTQAGNTINKVLQDEFLAASGTTAGTSTALTLAQAGFSLADGAVVRFKLHTDLGANATLNVGGTGAKALVDNETKSINVGAKAGAWVSATYSTSLGKYVMADNSESVGTIKPSVRTDLGSNWALANGAIVDSGLFPEVCALLSKKYTPFKASNTTSTAYQDIIYDATNNRYVVGYSTSSVSGIGILYATPTSAPTWTWNYATVTTDGSRTVKSIIYDSTNNRYLIVAYNQSDAHVYVYYASASNISSWTAIDLYASFSISPFTPNAFFYDPVRNRYIIGGNNNGNWPMFAQANGTSPSSWSMSTSSVESTRYGNVLAGCFDSINNRYLFTGYNTSTSYGMIFAFDAVTQTWVGGAPINTNAYASPTSQQTILCDTVNSRYVVTYCGQWLSYISAASSIYSSAWSNFSGLGIMRDAYLDTVNSRYVYLVDYNTFKYSPFSSPSALTTVTIGTSDVITGMSGVAKNVIDTSSYVFIGYSSGTTYPYVVKMEYLLPTISISNAYSYIKVL